MAQNKSTAGRRGRKVGPVAATAMLGSALVAGTTALSVSPASAGCVNETGWYHVATSPMSLSPVLSTTPWTNSGPATTTITASYTASVGFSGSISVGTKADAGIILASASAEASATLTMSLSAGITKSAAVQAPPNTHGDIKFGWASYTVTADKYLVQNNCNVITTASTVVHAASGLGFLSTSAANK